MGKTAGRVKRSCLESACQVQYSAVLLLPDFIHLSYLPTGREQRKDSLVLVLSVSQLQASRPILPLIGAQPSPPHLLNFLESRFCISIAASVPAIGSKGEQHLSDSHVTSCATA